MGLHLIHNGPSLDPQWGFIRSTMGLQSTHDGASLNPYHSITMKVYSIYKDFTKFAMFPFPSVKHHCTLVKISRCELWCSKVFELELGLRHFTSHGAGLQQFRLSTRGFNKSDFWSHLIKHLRSHKILNKISGKILKNHSTIRDGVESIPHTFDQIEFYVQKPVWYLG